MNTYVYANFEGDRFYGREAAWRWLLSESSSIEVLRIDKRECIEFKTSAKIIDVLWSLINENCETIFEGTLEEFYEELNK